MKDEDVKIYIGKKVKIFLKNNFVFNGDIQEINEGSIKLLDKFKEIVTIDTSEILLIKTNGDKR